MNVDSEGLFIFQITAFEAIANLSVALLCGFMIGMLYRITYKGVNYSGNYLIAIIMLTMITSLVIMVIGNNLARAFGLVGAMSIIRFRTAIKDTQDIMFIFFALAIGLACGAGMYLISMVGTCFIGLTVWVAVAINSENPKKKEYLLQIYTHNRQQDNPVILSLIEKYCSKFQLVNVKSMGEESRKVLEISYYVNLRKPTSGAELITGLNATEGVEKVNLYFDEE